MSWLLRTTTTPTPQISTIGNDNYRANTTCSHFRFQCHSHLLIYLFTHSFIYSLISMPLHLTNFQLVNYDLCFFFQFLTECFYAFLFSSANSRFWTLEAATADGGNEAKDANIQTSICIW